MSSLMTDVLEGNVSPAVSNAAVNAGGKLLKMIEMQMKYGTPATNGIEKTLQLCGTDEPDPHDSKAKIREHFAEMRRQLDHDEAAMLDG